MITAASFNNYQVYIIMYDHDDTTCIKQCMGYHFLTYKSDINCLNTQQVD